MEGPSPEVKAELFYVGKAPVAKCINPCEINRIMFLGGTGGFHMAVEHNLAVPAQDTAHCTGQKK
jgi:hypothetical protein